MSKALICVDIQNDFCEGGALPVAGGNEVAHRVRDYIIRTGDDYELVLLTFDWHVDPGDHWSENPDYINSWPKHCSATTTGAFLHKAVSEAYYWIDAQFFKGQYAAAYSGFEAFSGSVSLDDMLHYTGTTDVDVVGLAYDYCVRATALDAAHLGYKTTILTDLTAPVHIDKVGDLEHELLTAGVKLALSEEV